MSKIIIANWKSNHTLKSAQDWLHQLNQFVWDNQPDLELVLAPPYPLISGLAEIINSSQFKMAVQDISPYGAGSYTGAVSTPNLIGLPVDYALIGHSERRRFFGEIDEMEADKVKHCLEADITPILCLDKPYIESQARTLSAAGIKLPSERIVVVYEPARAIGSGANEDPALVKTVMSQIKELYGQNRVLYGGSVNADNVVKYLKITDGVLVGTYSLGADAFIRLIQAIDKSW